MIVGPNGAGKSTFVAAVCLGLGGKVDMIKRKTLDSMIKSGETEATIEIVLKNKQHEPNIKIERRFTLKLNKSTWKVDGEPSTVEAVRSLVLSFNIQLDNLCHFLPQERVAEFASLSPEKLLLETERTIGDSTLLGKHKLLMELDEHWLEASHQVDTLEENISRLKADVEEFEQKAQMLHEFEEKSSHINHHKKLLPFAKLQDLKEKMKHLKKIRDSAKLALQNFTKNTSPLEITAKQTEEDLALNAEKIDAVKAEIQVLREKSETVAHDATQASSAFSTMRNEIEQLKSQTENKKKELSKVTEERDDLRSKLRKAETVDDSEVESISRSRQKKHEEKSKIEDNLDSLKFEINSLKRNIEASEQRFRDERGRLDRNDRIEIFNTPRTRYRRELLENAYRAHVFLRKERKAQNLRYYESPIVSCRVTDKRYAKSFEKVIDNNSLFALYFDTEEDYQKVSAALPKDINVPMRVVSKAPLSTPMSSEKLRLLGFEGYLLEFLVGPEPVIQGLKHRSYLHCIPVCLKTMRSDVIERLLDAKDGKVPFFKFVIENSLYAINRSRYGSKQTFYQTEHIPEAQLLGAQGITEEVKMEIQHRLVDLKAKITEMQGKQSDIESEKALNQGKLDKANGELKELETEARALKRKKEVRSKLQDTISHAEARIEQLRLLTTQDSKAKIEETENSLLDEYLKYTGLMSELSVANRKLVDATIERKKLELLRQQMENRLATCNSLLEELDVKRSDLENLYLKAKSEYEGYKKGDAAKEIRTQNLSATEREIVRELAETYLLENRLTELYVLGKIEQLEDELSVLANVDRGSLEQLKSKRAQLEQAERQFPDLARKKNDLKERIDKIAIPWQEELSTMVDKISKVFQKKFATVASDGQIELAKLDRFKDWKLEILVKFRENSELKVLDHQSQSGGERAVSTIFFIMSLQGLTQAPIRIVDEINQGMDPKNERMAHKHLVHTACQESPSQYFLVTPKLLTGLYYHPGMSIHCIFTGPFLSDRSKNPFCGNIAGLQS